MKGLKLVVGALSAAVALTASSPGWSHDSRHRSRTHVGIFFGTPALWSWHYPPYYYYPPVIAVPAPPPPVYVEQAPPASAAPAPGYWYYCSNPDGYYPYVKECPGGWQKVQPQP